MDRVSLDAAVDGGDLDELLRVIDACCEQRDWEGLERLRSACQRSHESGRQLWPAASHAAYRLALESPAPFAARVLVEGAGRFAPGPLAEVAAQSHSWHELAPHVEAGAVATITAHERVVRGEDVGGAAPEGPVVLELPWHLEPWEPRYPLAEYHAHRAEFPAPASPPLALIELPPSSAVHREEPDEVSAALAETARVWAAESNGTVGTAHVRGGAPAAIAALGPRRVRMSAITAADALATVAWAAASGGAHGRRRGAASGRFGVWWLAGALADALDDWPPDGTRLHDTIASHRWHVWDAAEPMTGWQLRVAIEAPDGEAWAVAASDAA